MNRSTALARVLVDELVRNGVREVVLSPGSRSAPLAFAVYDAAAAGRLRLHVRIDERSAGFLALGLSKADHGPAAVITTSGTATANLHPAVLEAHHAGVPLLILTADRPPELRGVGANQTTDQIGLYGRAVRLFHEVGAPEERAGQVGYWRALACRVVAAARGTAAGPAGPAHLNLAFPEPLVPDSGGWVEPLDGRPEGRPWTSVAPVAATGGRLSGEPRTLMVVGDLSWPGVAADAVRLAERRGWPVIAEPSASAPAAAPVLAMGAHLVADDAWLATHLPERVLVVGRPTLTRPVARLLRDPRVAVDVVGQMPWPDPGHAARSVHPPESLAASLPATPERVDPTWLAGWQKADAAVRAAVDAVLDDAWPSGPRVAREVVEALPVGALFVLGSSNAVRHVFLAGSLPGGAVVLANRGVAGIDGTVSTAVGAALAHQRAGGGPGYALLGDLTFLHDSGGLVLGPREPRPDLCVVVANDDGGGIFGLLEQGAPEHAEAFERVFGTPHGVDLSSLCAATATPYRRADTADDLRAALAPGPGLRVVEVRTDRHRLPALTARMQEAVTAALRTLG